MTNSTNPNQNDEMVLVEIAPQDIDFFNKLIEGYDNLALVTTIDAKMGKLALWVARQSLKDLLAVLKCLPIPIHLVSHNT